MKMRQSLNQLERAFVEETTLERHRRESLRRTERRLKEGKARFIVLSLTLLVTAVAVAVVMFRALYLILE